MKYKIDNRVIYRTDDGLLWLIDNESEVLTLSPTANRLLNALIIEQGVAMSRELILARVWDDYGLISSSNSLNQYISHLRKALTSLGLDEHIIKTVPKVGVVFSKDVSVVLIDTRTNSNSDNAFEECSNPLQKDIKHSINYPVITLVLVSFFLLTIAMKYSPEERKIEPQSVGVINSCKVYSLNPGVIVNKIRLNNIVSSYMKEKGIACTNDGTIYFHGDHKLYASGKGKAYLALCSLHSDGSISNCENYLTQDWVEKS